MLNTFDALCTERGSGNLREIYTMLFNVFIYLLCWFSFLTLFSKNVTILAMAASSDDYPNIKL